MVPPPAAVFVVDDKPPVSLDIFLIHSGPNLRLESLIFLLLMLRFNLNDIDLTELMNLHAFAVRDIETELIRFD